MLDRLLDRGLNAVFSAQVGEHFTGNSWAKGVKLPDQALKPEVSNHLGRGLADGAEFAAWGRV